MGHLTNDDLKAIVTKGDEYKKLEEESIKALIVESKTRLESLEKELKRLETLIPFEAYNEMREDERRKAWGAGRDEERTYFDRVNAEDAASQIEIDKVKYCLWGALGGFFLGWVVVSFFG